MEIIRHHLPVLPDPKVIGWYYWKSQWGLNPGRLIERIEDRKIGRLSPGQLQLLFPYTALTIGNCEKVKILPLAASRFWVNKRTASRVVLILASNDVRSTSVPKPSLASTLGFLREMEFKGPNLSGCIKDRPARRVSPKSGRGVRTSYGHLPDLPDLFSFLNKDSVSAKGIFRQYGRLF